MRRRQMVLSSLLFGCFPAEALYQEYKFSGSVASAPGYNFATGQYRLYANDALLKKDFVAFEYDLDSFYADYAYAFNDTLRAGASGKTHIFDYQNLNHIVDSTTGAETKPVALVAPFFKAQGYVEARYRSLSLRYAAGAERFFLSARDSTNSALAVASPGVAFVHHIALGYWNLSQIKPYAFTGVAAYYSVEEQRFAKTYTWQSGGYPLSSPQRDVVIHELHVRAGHAMAGDRVKLMAAVRAGATNFALPGQAQDVIQSFSVGGPESRYRRIAGYSFSEFRVPAFGIVNLDAVMRLAGAFNLWMVFDAAVFDREPQGVSFVGASGSAPNPSRLYAGAGLGAIIDLPDGYLGSRSSVFARFDMPFAAAGGTRVQAWFGLRGQIF